MSKVGRRPIEVPQSVTVSIDGQEVSVSGPKGEFTVTLPDKIEVIQEGGFLQVNKKSNDKQTRAFFGTWRSHLSNMVYGVSEGYVRELELVGVGYRAALQENNLRLEVGYSHPVEMEIPDGLEVEVPENTKVVIRGKDKREVGHFAAKVRGIRPPEPYKGKGIRYKGEQVRIKPGKTGASEA